MTSPGNYLRLMRVLIVAVASLATPSCSALDNGFLNPMGQVAQTERAMLIEIALVTAIVVLPVFAITALVLLRYRRSQENSQYEPEWDYSRKIEWVVWSVPVAIVIVLGSLNWIRTQQLDHYGGRAGGPPHYEIQAVAFDWKWLFIYPDDGVASLDHLVLPKDRPVRVRITSATAMQSFHVPRLAGQVYAMGGMVTQATMLATQSGETVGRNTQFNGDGFPQQDFRVSVLDKPDFSVWTEHLRTTGGQLDQRSIEQLMHPSTPARPQYFGRVKSGLFEKIVMETMNGSPVRVEATP